MDALILLALAVTAPAFMFLGVSFLLLPGVMTTLHPNTKTLFWIEKSTHLKRAFINFGVVVFLCTAWGTVNVFKHSMDLVFLCAMAGVIGMAYITYYFFSFNLVLSIGATVIATYAIITESPRVGRESYTYEVVVVANVLLYLFLFFAWYKQREDKRGEK